LDGEIETDGEILGLRDGDKETDGEILTLGLFVGLADGDFEGDLLGLTDGDSETEGLKTEYVLPLMVSQAVVVVLYFCKREELSLRSSLSPVDL